MKKTLIVLFLVFLLCGTLLFALDKEKVYQEVPVRDISPYVSNPNSGLTLTDDMWDLQFSFDVTAASGAAGNAGAEFDGTYFYTTRWASNLIHKYDINGVLVSQFSIPGVTGLRDLAYDGNHFYGGAAANVIYEMDFDTQTLIGTISSSVAVRAIAYNEDLDAFYVSNFADPVGLISRTGTTLATFNCGLAGTYGFAYDNLTAGGPYLWIFDQGAGAGSAQLIHQMDATTHTMTGVTHNVSLELPDPSGIAGGLFLTTEYEPGYVTLGGLQQGVPDQVFCYELAVSADPLAPGAPTDVVVTPDAVGALEADIDWVCPTLQVNGDPLTDLDEMRVYRGEDLIYTDTAPTIGAAGNYTDVSVPLAGQYTYKVVGYNDFDEGLPVSVSVWVGQDIPDAVTNLTLTDVSTTTLIAELNWTNPTAGYHGGYFNGCTGYDIERVNDGATFNITGSTTTWQDITVPAPGIYSYIVTPLNGSGAGPSTTSAQVGIGVSLVQIGTGAINDYQIPMNLFYMDSMVETIYLQEWIGSDMLINTVSYHAATTTTIPNNFLLEVWMGVTQETSLSAGWITGAQLTQVFAGSVTVPAGDSWVDFSLDTPYEYEFNGNLVIMVIREDDQYFSTTDVWKTTESGTAFRTRHVYTDNSGGQAYNAMTGPFTGTLNKSTYPDVRLTYSELAHGDVGGVVTNSVTAAPISGVEVYVGNWGPATTNASGVYLLEDLVVGLQAVTATKDGFYDFFGEVTVLANQVVTYNIVMDPNIFGALDGTVTDSDTGAPLVGAEISAISAGGYEYDTVTNATGYYSIVDVVAETYDVYCSYPNYPTGVEQGVVVLDGQTSTVDFALEGYAFWCNFESNDGGLISDNTAGWQWGTFTSGPMTGYSGTNGWGTVIGGTYPNGSNFRLDTPVPFFVESPLAMLEFWHWYDIEGYGYDGGNVKVSTDGGTSWTVITPLTGYPGVANASNPLNGEPIFCNTVPGNFWALVEFDLSSYQGQSIIIRWHFGSDSSVQYPGWYIDDVSISGCTVPEQGSLEGTVVEFGTANPIQGAVVTVGTGLNATTGADGTYNIPGIWPGLYDITCVAPLYLDAEELNFSIATGVNTLDFAMLWSELAVNVTALNSYLPPDETEVQTFTITNNGPGDLEYNISFEYPEAISVRQISVNKKVQTSRSNVTTPLVTKKTSSSDRDESPYVSQLPAEISREMWDLQFSFDATAASGAAGNAGAEFDGTYFYTTRWASSLIHKYDINGVLVSEFSIPGVSGLRDLAYDGTHFYGGAAGNVIYEMDFDTQTLIGTISSSVAVRAIAYNDVLDAFYVSNFADPVGLISRTGTTLATFNCGLAGTYGFAYDSLTDGGPYLWIFDQGAGAGAAQLIHQMNATTHTMTGVTHNVSLELPDPSGIAGGLFLTTDYVPGIITLGGLQQGVPDQVFCYELAPYSTWVAVTANGSGTVPGNGGSVLVEVTFDATELLIGDFLTADLLIHNNSNYVTDGDDYVIPVSLTVTGFIPPSNLFVDVNTWLFTWDAPPGPNLLGYNVFLDDMTTPIGTTATTQWQYTDLVGGQPYVAGVSAVYDDGESQVMQYQFTPVNTGNIIPLVTELRGNFPNPFNPDTKIAFSLNKQSHVQITVYNIKGQLVRTLVDEERDANNYTVIWNGTDNNSKAVSSGVYFYKMKTDGYTSTRKMIMMK